MKSNSSQCYCVCLNYANTKLPWALLHLLVLVIMHYFCAFLNDFVRKFVPHMNKNFLRQQRCFVYFSKVSINIIVVVI